MMLGNFRFYPAKRDCHKPGALNPKPYHIPFFARSALAQAPVVEVRRGEKMVGDSGYYRVSGLGL